MNRRDFLREAALGAATVGLTAPPTPGAAADRATVVIVHLPGAGASAGPERLVAVQRMVAAGLHRLTGLDGAAAWLAFVQPTDRVVLKVNALAARIATSPELADAVARGCLAAGVAGEACLVFDRFERELRAAGYPPGPHPAGYQIVATDSAGRGYDDQPSVMRGVSQRLSRVISRDATAILNLPVVKDHNIAGVTAALKNHYGSIAAPQQLHGDRGDPHIPDVCCLPAIRDRHRLVIGDALTIVFDGGPGSRSDRRLQLDRLLLSRDPVAHDAVAWQMIEAARQAKGLRPLAREGREPTWLATAAAPPRSLGVADPTRIDQVVVELT